MMILTHIQYFNLEVLFIHIFGECGIGLELMRSTQHKLGLIKGDCMMLEKTFSTSREKPREDEINLQGKCLNY